ncbi:predicted dehydrogenase [Terrimicrobium sacchariphilum]|uniref:Predicted dehydrogenase n=1 Tax=Terrimicrobium sacchariphilum TaxID=690879 RepID=A0A146GC21_TERSA|nr:Gfo/Idh/MocA family oxidoreductase [Terrimicrobium sacchariphilum]GAT35159.1 predicted dehydrogenase [Terrimicrobium sacchariphilum]
MKLVDVVLVGIGGYGARYVRALDDLPEARLVAVVDPMAESTEHWNTIQERGVRQYRSLGDFLAAGGRADLAVISSPIGFHQEQSCLALRAGMNVLCEKPISATMEEALRMIEARDAAGRFLEIGYQWSFSRAIRQLKEDILAGIFGDSLLFKTLVAWPRGSAYYGRNDWSGRITNDEGRPVYDSPVNNATAHYLHNMLFLGGRSMESAAHPIFIEAECYRGNEIENFDTACCRITTDEVPEILFLTSHCVERNFGPIFELRFERGTIRYPVGGSIEAILETGRHVNYGDPEADPMGKLRLCLERCRCSQQQPAFCGPEAAASLTACVEGIQRMPVHRFPANDLARRPLHSDDDVLVYLPGLVETFQDAFEVERLPSEFGVPWTSPAGSVDLTSGFGRQRRGETALKSHTKRDVMLSTSIGEDR